MFAFGRKIITERKIAKRKQQQKLEEVTYERGPFEIQGCKYSVFDQGVCMQIFLAPHLWQNMGPVSILLALIPPKFCPENIICLYM